MTEQPKENTVEVKVYNTKTEEQLPNEMMETEQNVRKEENNEDKKSDEKKNIYLQIQQY